MMLFVRFVVLVMLNLLMSVKEYEFVIWVRFVIMMMLVMMMFYLFI